MADINLREYYSVLLTLDPLLTHRISMLRIAKLTVLKAYIEEMKVELDRHKRILISKELKKPFLQKLFELKGAV